MKITCHNCSAKYAIADDKVRGRRVKVRCKSCRTAIVVDGYAMEEDAQAGAMHDAAGPDDDYEATRVQPSSPAADAWTVNITDDDQRSLTTEQIVAAWQTGEVNQDAYVWKDGMDDWLPILDVPELAAYLSAAAPAAAPSQPPPPGSEPPPAG